MDPLLILSAGAIGLVLGATGGGGALLAVPVFVHVMHIDPRLAIAMSLPVVGLTSLVGALGHWVAGHVQIRPALAFGAVAMTGAYLGARLSIWLSGTTQLTILSLVMIAAAVSLWQRSRTSTLVAMSHEPPTRSLVLLAAVGFGVGVLTGLVGVGGGFLFAPALTLLMGMPLSHAAGTSLLIIAMNAAAGFAGYAGQVVMPWRTVGEFVAVAAAASLVGLALARVIPQRAFQRAFAVFLLVIAAALLYQRV